MKKIRIISLLLMLCLICSACGARKSDKQLDSSEFLFADGTLVRDASGQQVRLASKRFVLSAEELPTSAQLSAVLADETYNSITLDIKGELIDDSVSPWGVKEEALTVISSALKACSDAEKYLLLDISEYPQDYNAWYENSGFPENVAALWQSLADLVAQEPYFGAYLLSGFPRAGASENKTALSYYEELLQIVCDGIRTKDEYHMIGVGAITPYSEDEDDYLGLPYIKDHNFIYCAPLEELDYYSKQTKESTDGSAHLTYPNDLWHNITGISTQDKITGSDIDLSSTQYQTRATAVFQVEQEGLFARIGANVVPPDQNGGGELRVWSVHFAECDQDGNELNVLYDMQTSVDIPFMCLAASGTLTEGSVYEDDGSAYLESMNEPTFFFVENLNIPVEKDKYYQLTVTMKQRGMNKDFSCAPYVELYSCKNYNTMDVAYLEQYCTELYTEALAVGVPMIFDDIGVTAAAESKGGEQYMTDLLAAIGMYEQSYIGR